MSVNHLSAVALLTITFGVGSLGLGTTTAQAQTRLANQCVSTKTGHILDTDFCRCLHLTWNQTKHHYQVGVSSEAVCAAQLGPDRTDITGSIPPIKTPSAGGGNGGGAGGGTDGAGGGGIIGG